EARAPRRALEAVGRRGRGALVVEQAVAVEARAAQVLVDARAAVRPHRLLAHAGAPFRVGDAQRGGGRGAHRRVGRLGDPAVLPVAVPLLERAPRPRADEAVDLETVLRLEGLHRALRRRAVDAEVSLGLGFGREQAGLEQSLEQQRDRWTAVAR